MTPSIPRKPKVEAVKENGTTNGAAGTNGVQSAEPGIKTLKRAHPDDDELVIMPKKAKTVQSEANDDDDDVVIVEDEGAILIDD